MLPPAERRVVEEVFGDVVFDRYGSEEVGLIASECERHDGMHVAAEGVCVEILDGTEEVPGRIVRIGNTSRTVEFEARKVIASRYDLSPSAADVLATPIVTCRAVGTTVIPRDHSRRAEILAAQEERP